MVLPDDRCIGGRQSIELELYNMRRKIYNAKSTIDNRLDANTKRGLTDKGRKVFTPRPVLSDGFDEIRETYRRVGEVQKRMVGKEGRTKARASGYLDKTHGTMSGPPKTYGLASRLSYNRAVKRTTVDLTLKEHHNNISHMYRRIEDQYSKAEKKKNVHNASIYPTYIRRRSATTAPSTLRTSAGHRVEETLAGYSEYTPRDAYSEHIVTGIASPRLFTSPRGVASSPRIIYAPRGDARSKMRPGSAPMGGRRAPLTHRADDINGGEFDDLAATTSHTITPSLPKDELFLQYYHAMMEEIITDRVYKEDALKKLFRKYLANTAGEMRDVVLKVIATLKKELEVY